MAKNIWRIPIQLTGAAQTFRLPQGADPVYFGTKGGGYNLWVEFDQAKADVLEEQTFLLVGTGFEVPDACNYIGTVIEADTFVWHLYDLP